MARRKTQPLVEEPLEIDGVPTLAGLVRRGGAQRRTDRSGRTYFWVNQEGHDILSAAFRERMKENQRRGVSFTVHGKIYLETEETDND